MSRPIAHAIWDPHCLPAIDASVYAGATVSRATVYSGVYHWWHELIGMRTADSISAVFYCLAALFFCSLLATLATGSLRPSLAWFKSVESWLNHHL